MFAFYIFCSSSDDCSHTILDVYLILPLALDASKSDQIMNNLLNNFYDWMYVYVPLDLCMNNTITKLIIRAREFFLVKEEDYYLLYTYSYIMFGYS